MADELSWVKKPKNEAEIGSYLQELFRYCAEDDWNAELKRHLEQKLKEAMSGDLPS